jgi:hypothetical protein
MPVQEQGLSRPGVAVLQTNLSLSDTKLHASEGAAYNAVA